MVASITSLEQLHQHLSAHQTYLDSAGERGQRLVELSGLKINNVDFSSINLAGIICQDTQFVDCRFRATVLIQAKFDLCLFTQCNFDYALLLNAEFYRCRIKDVSFEHAFLQRSQWHGMDLDSTSFHQAHLNGAMMDECNLLCTNISREQTSQSHLFASLYPA